MHTECIEKVASPPRLARSTDDAGRPIPKSTDDISSTYILLVFVILPTTFPAPRY